VITPGPARLDTWGNGAYRFLPGRRGHSK
jgi:hypothetical protein